MVVFDRQDIEGGVIIMDISSIKNQIAVIPGGAAGIGLACAQRYSAEGAKVAIIDRDQKNGMAALATLEEKGGEAMFTPAECTSESEMDSAIAEVTKKWGKVDILANCAGGFHSAPPIEEVDAIKWSHGIEWNLSGVYIPIRSVVPIMKSNKYGRIVSIGSAAGRTAALIASIDYSAAKAAVGGLSRRLAIELAPHGITVNTVAPGTVMTPRIAVLHSSRMKQLEKAMPVGRLGEPEEIAPAVWYLSTPGAAFTTGAILDVNGGSWTG